MLYYIKLLIHKIDKIKMAGTSHEISRVKTSAANNYNTRLDSSVRIKLVSAPKSHEIEYVLMHTIREITRLATMLAGLVAPRLCLGFVSATSRLRLGFDLVQALSLVTQ